VISAISTTRDDGDQDGARRQKRADTRMTNPRVTNPRDGGDVGREPTPETKEGGEVARRRGDKRVRRGGKEGS
jgi:hypothetical protein